jgi:hypothetical protein
MDYLAHIEDVRVRQSLQYRAGHEAVDGGIVSVAAAECRATYGSHKPDALIGRAPRARKLALRMKPLGIEREAGDYYPAWARSRPIRYPSGRPENPRQSFPS